MVMMESWDICPILLVVIILLYIVKWGARDFITQCPLDGICVTFSLQWIAKVEIKWLMLDLDKFFIWLNRAVGLIMAHGPLSPYIVWLFVLHDLVLHSDWIELWMDNGLNLMSPYMHSCGPMGKDPLVICGLWLPLPYLSLLSPRWIYWWYLGPRALYTWC